MKQIEIGEKIAPFSHQSGTECLVPLSDWKLCIYPALIRISNSIEIPIRITGPVSQFIVQMDLERDCIFVSGIAQEGHYRFKLSASEEGLSLTVDRAPKGGIVIGSNVLKTKEKILLSSGGKVIAKGAIERISFGNFKAQDWDLVRRRNDPKEILPALYLLGQKIPAAEAKGGTATLLDNRRCWKPFLLASFSGILLPHLKDVLHQGIAPQEEGVGDPNALLSMAYRVIRECFIDVNKQIRILARLPKSWIAGRATGLRVAGVGRIDLEWTKGTIRRMIVDAAEECKAPLIFSKEVELFRCNGKRFHNGDILILKKGKTLFDRFQK